MMQIDQNAQNIFISYDSKDENALQELETHLSLLKKQGFISTCHHRKILPGTNWAEAMDEYLEQASIILLLISPDFLASDYCYQVEMKRALARHKEGTASVIPIIIRDCDWSSAPFAHLQVLPTDARPITTWIDRDQAWTDVITGIRRVLNGASFPEACAPHLTLPPIWTIPFLQNPFFLGQDDLLVQLHQRLRPGTTMALTQIQAISGLGGIGKTQIAVEYAYRYRDAYPFVFWVRAEHPQTLITDLASLASELRLPEERETDQMKVVAAVKQWLATHQGWLLIFDNADDVSQLIPFLPGRHSGAILLTTRATETLPVAEPLQVELMDELAGAEFLLRRARMLLPGMAFAHMASEDQRAARQVCQVLGRLPLALDQAGAYIDATQCSVQDYLNFYQQDQSVRIKLLHRRGQVTAGHPEPVATTWALAFARVEQASPAAADLLRACAFLDPDLIPEELLQQGAPCWGSALARVANDPFLWNETIGELLKYALVRRSREQKALSIHRLVQTVLRDAMDQPTHRQWVERTIQAVERVFPDGRNPAHWPTCKRLHPHAQVCAMLIESYDLSSAKSAWLLHRTADYLWQHVRYSEAEALYQRELRTWEQGLGTEHPNVAYPLYGLAELCRGRGMYREAEPLYRRVLGIRERSLGSKHPNMPYSLYGLAITCFAQGKYREAEQLHQRALHLWERILGGEHPDLIYSLNGLANIYFAQGKYREAEQLYQRALGIWERSPGGEHPRVTSPLYGLANIYSAQGKYREAEQLYQRALRLWEHSLGGEHPDVAYPVNGLADISYREGNYREAEALYQRALRVREKSPVSEHPFTHTVRKNYANLLRAMKRAEEARKLEGQ